MTTEAAFKPMSKEEFEAHVQELLNRTLQQGPGPRAVVSIVAELLFKYICNEAGALAPNAIDEVVWILKTRLAEVKAKMYA